MHKPKSCSKSLGFSRLYICHTYDKWSLQGFWHLKQFGTSMGFAKVSFTRMVHRWLLPRGELNDGKLTCSEVQYCLFSLWHFLCTMTHANHSMTTYWVSTSKIMNENTRFFIFLQGCIVVYHAFEHLAVVFRIVWALNATIPDGARAWPCNEQLYHQSQGISQQWTH